MYNSSKPYTQRILDIIKMTWIEDHPFYKIQDGLYPIMVGNDSLPNRQMDHTDGIGTKGYYHWKAGTLYEAVQDVMAMNLNDLAMASAEAFKMQSHIVLPEDDDESIEMIVTFLAEHCRKRKILYTGGETSIHWNLKGMDISVTMSGALDVHTCLNEIKHEDRIFAFPSSGLHSNGFSLIHKHFPRDFLTEFVEPTAIYYDTIRQIPADLRSRIHAMMHITGGAFTKLNRIKKPSNLFMHILHGPLGPEPQAVFHLIKERSHLKDEGMYKNFNCGIGFLLFVGMDDCIEMENELMGKAFIVGQVSEKRHGEGDIVITSAFGSNKEVTL